MNEIPLVLLLPVITPVVFLHAGYEPAATSPFQKLTQPSRPSKISLPQRKLYLQYLLASTFYLFSSFIEISLTYNIYKFKVHDVMI